MKRYLYFAFYSLCTLGAATGMAGELEDYSMTKKKGRYIVSSVSHIEASREAVFSVLTDFENYQQLSTAFVEHYYIDGNACSGGNVFTKTRGCVAFFCTEVDRYETLATKPPESLSVVAEIETSDVEFAEAYWKLESTETGTRIYYHMEFEPGFWIPPLLGAWLIKRKLKQSGLEIIDRIELAAARYSDSLDCDGG